MNKNVAIDVAVEGLTFLAADTERLGRFLAETGVSPADLRTLATDADFQASLLGFLRQDESLLMIFCSTSGRTPDDVERAQVTLGGLPGETGAL